MKFNTINRSAKAAVMSLAIGLGTVACSRDYTADYVYSVSNTTGAVSAFAVDFQSGVLTQISGSPFTSNLQNPTTIIAAPNGKTIYVIGGSFNAQVAVMTVGSDGKLFAQATPSIFSGATFPTAAAIDSTGSYLYVTYTYQSGFSPTAPGPGGVTIFPITSSGTLGTPSNLNLGVAPVAVATAAATCTSTPALTSAQSGITSPNCIITNSGSTTNNGFSNLFVYIVDSGNGGTQQPTLLGFAENPTNGSLTPTTGTSLTTFQGVLAGVAPSAIAIDPTGEWLYITDEQQNEAFGYQIARTTTGNLTSLPSNPVATGEFPMAITFEPRGKYVYVANYNSNTVSSYSLNQANGSLSASAGSGFTTVTGPTCVTVDPALGLYLYTSDFLTAQISGGQLNPDTGQLTAVADSFFATPSQPICLTSVPNGAHAVQVITQ
jgi:6-phosphogluconolactonase